MIRSFRGLLGRKPTFRAHFWQSAANYVQQGFAVIFGIILARLLHPADFGHYAFAFATISLFLMPAGWSLAPLVVADAGRDPVVVSDAMRFAWKVSGFQAGLCAIGGVYLYFQGGSQAAGLGVASGLAQAASNMIGIQRASLEAKGQFKANFYDSLMMAGISLVVSIPAALLGMGPWSLILPALPMLIGQYFLFRRFSGMGFRPALQPSGNPGRLHNGFVLWLASLGEQILTRADKTILGLHSPASDLGNYNRAFNYAPLSARILNSLMTNPTIFALTKAESGRAKASLLIRTGGVLILGGLMNYVIFAWFSDPLVPLVFGDQWREAIPVFQAMAPLSLAIMMAYLPTTILLAKRSYGVLATVRVVVVITFLAWALSTSHNLNAVSMAYGVQAAMAAQGLLFCLCLIPSFLRNLPGTISR